MALLVDNKTNDSSTMENVSTELTPYYILTLVMGVMAVLLNGLLLAAMICNASTIFTSTGAYLVANVAIADLITGLNSSLWGFSQSFSRSVEHCLFALYWIGIAASFSTIFVMSLERYIAIVWPFKADAWLSKPRTIQSCFLVWIIAIMFGILIAFYTQIVTLCLTVFFEMTIVVTTVFYYKVFIKLGQRRACLPSQINGAGRMNADLKREYRLTTVVVVLTLILTVTVLPYMIGAQIAVAGNLLSVAHDPNLGLFLHYYMPVELMNFVLNPIVYAWRLPKYRYALIRLFKFK